MNINIDELQFISASCRAVANSIHTTVNFGSTQNLHLNSSPVDEEEGRKISIAHVWGMGKT